MRRVATVDSVLPDGAAELLVRRESACSGDCHKCAGCGAVEQTLRLTARNPIHAQPGEKVWIESESRVVLWAAALFYLMPLLLALAGYLAALPLGGWAAAVAAACFALGFLPACFYNRHLKKRPPEYVIAGRVEC